MNNEVAFESIFQDFGDGDVSVVVLYSGGEKEDTLVCYGVLMEGNEKDKEKMIEKTGHYIKALETNFRGVYKNADIIPLTRSQNYLFKKFSYNHLTMLRGVPCSEQSIGSKTGTNYANPMMVGKQMTETLLSGFEANKKNGVMSTEDFLFLIVLDPIMPEEIHDGIVFLSDLVNRTKASAQYSKGESDSVGFPFLMTPSIGEAYGTSETEADSVQQSIANGTSASEMWSESEQLNKTNSEAVSKGETATTGQNEGSTKGKADQVGGGGGWKFLIDASGNYSHTWNESDSVTNIDQESVSKTEQEMEAISKGFSNVEGGSKGTSHVETQGSGRTVSNAQTESQNTGMSGVGGVSQNQGLNVMRQLEDNQNIYAYQIVGKNFERYTRGYNDGKMFETRMILLTKTEQGKVLAEEITKTSYKDKEATIPIRPQRYHLKEEKKLVEYAKGLSRPFASEKKEYLVEDNRYTTNLTTYELGAFSPPQENYTGYTSSYDEIPPATTKPGMMEDGLTIGKQIDINQNEVTGYEYKIPINALGHIGIFGGSGSGKTELVFKLMEQLREKKYNVLSLDWAKNHRKMMGKLRDKSSIKFNSFDPKMELLKINFLKAPRGVSIEVWNDKIVYFLCHAFGFGRKQYATIKQCVDKITRNMPNPTMNDLLEEIENHKQELIEANQRPQLTFQQEEMFVSMETRFKNFRDDWKMAYKIYNHGPFTPIESLIEGDFFHLIECAELPLNIKKFMTNTILAGLYLYCKSQDKELEKPMFVIMEEAHSVMGGNGDAQDPLPKEEDIFEEISREARNYNLFIVYICQQPELIEAKIFGNLMITITFRLGEVEGRDRIVASAGRDPKKFDVDLVKWIGMQPRGVCLIRLNQFDHIRDGQFVPVKADYEKMNKINNDFFMKMYRKLSSTGRSNSIKEKK